MTIRAVLAILGILLTGIVLPATARPPQHPGPSSIVVGSGDSVVVQPPGVTIKVLALQAGKSARFEVADATGKRTIPLSIGATYSLGGYVLELKDVVKLCEISVVYAPPVTDATKLITSHGWHVSSPPKTWRDSVPKPLGGPAWTHYESASAALGFDLASAAGQAVEMRRYTVDEKTGRGQAIYVFLAVARGHVVGAWMSSEAPVAPGIVPLDSRAPLGW